MIVVLVTLSRWAIFRRHEEVATMNLHISRRERIVWPTVKEIQDGVEFAAGFLTHRDEVHRGQWKDIMVVIDVPARSKDFETMPLDKVKEDIVVDIQARVEDILANRIRARFFKRAARQFMKGHGILGETYDQALVEFLL